MDTKFELKLLVSSFEEPYRTRFETGILTHINRAELYFDKALSEDDEMFFTDVIYRCNHAYEGILKEAHYIFFEGKSNKLTPNIIEEDFLANKVINDRVKNLLTSYRQDWRNPSTHDYQLFFSKEEAFMAILSVSSFVYTLLSQLLISQAYSIIKNKGITRDKTKGFDFNTVLDKIVIFSSYLRSEKIKAATEFQVEGYLSAYLEKIFPDLLIKTDYRFGGGIADIIIEYQNKIVCVIEIKKYFKKKYDSAYLQTWNYIDKLGCNYGIVYLFSYDENVEYNTILDTLIGNMDNPDDRNDKEKFKNKIGNTVAVISPIEKQ